MARIHLMSRARKKVFSFQVEKLLKSPLHRRMIEEDLYDVFGAHGVWNATAVR